MQLWIKINIFIETFIFCFELISEQIISKLFYFFIKVVGRNVIHNQLDLLNSCLYKLRLFLQGILFFSITRLKKESLIIAVVVLILLFETARFCSSIWKIIIFNLLALKIALVVIIITVLLFPSLIIISSSLWFLSSLPHFQIFFEVDFSIQN